MCDQAQAVLDALAGIARCPSCGEICNGPWMRMDGHDVAVCITYITICKVAYFRRDGAHVDIGTTPIPNGAWAWVHDSSIKVNGHNVP